MSSQPITSCIYQRLLYLLTNQITHQGFNFQLTNTTTGLWRLLPHRLSKRRSITTVLLRTPITQMIFFNQGILTSVKTFSSQWKALSALSWPYMLFETFCHTFKVRAASNDNLIWLRPKAADCVTSVFNARVLTTGICQNCVGQAQSLPLSIKLALLVAIHNVLRSPC